MMKFLKGLAGVLLALSGPAFAADLPLKAVRAPVVAPAFSWSGWYAGLTAGGEWGSADFRTSTVFDPFGYFTPSSVSAVAAAGPQHIDLSGGTVGGELGYNWQVGAGVFGVETDFEYFGLRGSTSSTAVYPNFAPATFTINSSVKTDWLFTLRPRVGITADNWLLYVTGGLAVTDLKSNFLFTDSFGVSESASLSHTQAGWVAGVGAEYAFGGRWSGKVEYLHVDFGTVTVSSANLISPLRPFTFPTSVFTHSTNLTSDIVRAGINFHL